MKRTICRLGLALATSAAFGAGSPATASAQWVVDDVPTSTAIAVGVWGAPDFQSESRRPVLQEGFETTGFAQFMASPAGRVLRGVAGAAMIGGGIAIGDAGGTALALAGALPLSAGVLDLCYVSALFGGPIRGEDIREAGR